MNKREKGTYFESIACNYIKENGAGIILRNFRCRSGEIDIIAQDGKYLSFIEVKYRTETKYGSAKDAVDYRKQIRICRVSDFYRKKFGISWDIAQRFDVIAMETDADGLLNIKWIKNAFPYIAPYNKNFR